MNWKKRIAQYRRHHFHSGMRYLVIITIAFALNLVGCASQYKSPSNQLSDSTSKLVFRMKSERFNSLVAMSIKDLETGEKYNLPILAKGEMVDLYADDSEIIVPANKPIEISGTLAGDIKVPKVSEQFQLTPEPGATYFYDIYFSVGEPTTIFGEGKPVWLRFSPAGVDRPYAQRKTQSEQAVINSERQQNNPSTSAGNPGGMIPFYEKELQREDLDNALRTYYEGKLAELKKPQ